MALQISRRARRTYFRYGSFGNNRIILELSLTAEDAITFVPNYDGRRNFFHSSEWEFGRGDEEASIHITEDGRDEYTDALFLLPVSRYGNGLAIRIVIPIAMLMLLASSTFWTGSVQI